MELAQESTIQGPPLSGAYAEPRHAELVAVRRDVNVSPTERLASLVGGAALALHGLRRRGLSGLVFTLLGGSLAYRGATGHCDLYEALGINTTSGRGRSASVQHGEGFKVEKAVTINRPPEELYRYWRNFENLPHIMSRLEAVRLLDERRSHWVVKAPAGATVEWDAEIYTEQENELISWRSLEGAQIPNAGSVRFEKAPNARGTVVKVALNYSPPGAALGALVAKLFGEEPGQQLAEDLRRFKMVMEAGEIATTQGQPSGR